MSFVGNPGFGAPRTGKTKQAITVAGANFGAYGVGTVIPAGTDIEDILRNAMTVRVLATYANPTIDLSVGGTLVFEIGTNLSLVCTSSFSQNDAGAIINHQIFKGGVILASGTLSSLSIADTFSLLGTVSYQSSVSYQSGAIKLDNLGSASPIGAIVSGQITSNTINIVAQRGCFFGTGIAPTTSAQVRGLSGFALGLSQGRSFSISFSSGTTTLCFAYPASIRDVFSVKYRENANQEIRDVFRQTLVNVEGANGVLPISYKVYTYQPIVPFTNAGNLDITL